MERHNGYFKKIDFVFNNAGKIREAVQEAKYGKQEHNVNGSGVSDPTAAEAMHNIMPIRFVEIDGGRLEWPESWLRVYDMTYKFCDEMQLDVMVSKYAKENYKVTCERLNISQPTRSRLWAQVRHIQELCAVQEQLIRIF